MMKKKYRKKIKKIEKEKEKKNEIEKERKRKKKRKEHKRKIQSSFKFIQVFLLCSRKKNCCIYVICLFVVYGS